jgi:hypothetical protein
MSGNYVFYAAKMRELKSVHERNRPLYGQVTELLEFVLLCEARWGPVSRRRGRADWDLEVQW